MQNTKSEIESQIIKLRANGSKFSLDAMLRFAEILQNPQDGLNIIHIAGSNGKGSTSAFCESILRAHNFNVGLFTSPHLLEINERIQINRINISDSDFVKEFKELELAAKKMAEIYPELKATFFEYITAMALKYFKEKSVDFAVLEVGLGGRLDASNIVKPKICAITSIALEHTQYLGNSIAEIACQKAGIIKKNTPVVCGILPKEAISEIEKIAKEKNAPLYKLEDFYTLNPQFDTSFEASYQKKNAALAFLICKILSESTRLFEFSEAKAKDALLDTTWSARWQKIPLKNNITLILDCSHNVEGAVELEKNLEVLIKKNNGKKPIIVTGILGIDRAIPLLKVISKYARKILFVEPKEDRALTFKGLEKCLPESHPLISNKQISEIFNGQIESNFEKGDTIVCTGSCYLAGEVLSIIKNLKRDNFQDILPNKNTCG